MLTWLKELITKPTTVTVPSLKTMTRPAGFQLASPADELFIFKSILAEAQSDHFSKNYLIPYLQPGLSQQIQSSIKNKECPTHRGTTSKSEIYIHINENMPIGFSWVVETENDGEKEIYLLSVSPDHRDKGIGKDLISNTILQYPKKTKFIARLYPASKKMKEILQSIGFKIAPRRGKDTVCLSFISD